MGDDKKLVFKVKQFFKIIFIPILELLNIGGHLDLAVDHFEKGREEIIIGISIKIGEVHHLTLNLKMILSRLTNLWLGKHSLVLFGCVPIILC